MGNQRRRLGNGSVGVRRRGRRSATAGAAGGGGASREEENGGRRDESRVYSLRTYVSLLASPDVVSLTRVFPHLKAHRVTWASPLIWRYITPSSAPEQKAT